LYESKRNEQTGRLALLVAGKVLIVSFKSLLTPFEKICVISGYPLIIGKMRDSIH
jgi:hypothetical protein